MADEAAAGGIVPQLLELVDSEDDKLSLQAYTVLLPLTCHPRSAAIVGNSGGIDFFLSHLDSPRKHIVRKDLISGLCLLAKEGVNRVKLRDSNGWKVFLETLQDDSLVDVQDRVISCLVSFLYDDKTLSLMLEDGLVNILLTHLQRCGNYMSDFSVNLFRNAEMLLKPEASKSTTTVDTLHETSLTDDVSAHKRGSLADDTSVSRFEKEVDAGDRKILEKDSELAHRKVQSEPALDEASTNISQAQTLKNANTAVDQMSDNEELQKPPRSQSPISLEEKNKDVVNDSEHEDKTVDDSRASRTHVYSINSPTYQAETTWRMEDYHPGVTRKTYHHTCSPGSPTNGFDESRSPPHFPYSPLSMQSYTSPSHSGHLSPQSFPTSSPAYSYSTLSPVHSPSVSQGCTSPAYSSAASSDDLPSFNHQPQMSSTGILSPVENTDFYVFSSSEDDDEEDVEKETDNDDIVDTSADGETQLAMKVHCQLGKDGTGAVDPRLAEEKMANHSTNFLQDFGDMFDDCKSAEQGSVEKIQTGPRFFKVQDAASSDSEPVVKRRKLQPSAGVHASTTQNNILMLLSRLSVRDDVSHHFASYKVIQCLIDHLALADKLHYRCVRILSRVLSSPHCFSSLLKMCAPAVLIKTFMLDSDLKLFSQETIPNNQVSRHLSLEEKNTRSLMLSGSHVSRSLSVESRFSVTKSQSNASFQEDSSSHSLESGKSITHRRFSSDPDKPDPGTKTEEQGSQLASNEERSQENLAKIGRTLLQDLSAQALSPYSEGVILHTFSCMSSAHQLMCAASILFLMTYCPREKRQKLLVHGGALEKVVSALCIQHSGDPVIKDVLGLGLICLSRTLNFTPRFDAASLPRLLNQAMKCFRSGASPVPGSAATSEQMASPNRDVCSYNGVEKDLKIIVRKRESSHVLYANRERLVRNSPVFAAMLQGSYIESTQSEISITGVCPKALMVILHYLHCCDDRCCVLKSLGSYTDHVNDVKQSATKSEPEQNQPSPMSQSLNNKTTVTRKRQLKFLLNTIAAADRFLLPELVQYLCSVVSTSLMDECCAEEVLCFATLHGLSELAEDCLQVFLSSVSSVAEGTAFLMTLAEGDSSSVVHATLVSLFKRGVANTP